MVPPIYQSSVYTLADLEVLDRISRGEEPGFIYARDAHPNAHDLSAELARWEGGRWGLTCSSGMGSLSVAFLGLLKQGDRVVASNRLYGRTSSLLRQELSRFGVASVFVDANDLDQVREVLQTPTQVLYVETISNPMVRVVDLPALAEICKRQGTKLVVDNTFASPILCRPLELGADLVMESLTKIIGGHSDLTLGFLAGIDPELFPKMSQIMSIWGFSSNPFDCWLARRSLETLELRTHAASQNALQLAEWLEEQPGVSRVIYPGLQSHPDYELAQKLLPQGQGHMLCFELQGGGRESVNRFMRQSAAIPFSPSLGHTATSCSYPWGTSHRYESPEEKIRQGITEGLIRLSVGIEPLEKIKIEMGKSL